jgi:LytS/YehU family sensor histidine kinase
MNILTGISVIFTFTLSLWLMNITVNALLKKDGIETRKRNITRYIISYAATIGIAAVYCYGLIQTDLSLRNRVLVYPAIAALTNNTVIIVIMDFVILVQKKSQIELENTRLKMNDLIAQHQHLKHQLHPHFLFNSLSTLKYLIKKQPQEAEEYLLRLSDFLRASITVSEHPIIPLKQELDLCRNYMEMQKVRFKQAFDYEMQIPGHIVESAYVPVLALQLLVENAIKHNTFTIEMPLHIDIILDADGSIVVSNNKMRKWSSAASAGIGLKNLSERYRMIAGKDISIRDEAASFTVVLKLLHT